MIIKTGSRWRMMEAIKVRPNGEIDGAEVAHADSKEELDILLARERLKTLEEDTKVQLGEKERVALIKAHLDRLQGDVDKRNGVEESLEKLKRIQEGLKVKKFTLEQKVEKDEKDKRKLMEIEKLIEVSKGQEKCRGRRSRMQKRGEEKKT